MGNGSSKPKKVKEGETPLEYMVRNFEALYKTHDYGVELTKEKLKVMCTVVWPLLVPGWPEQGSMDPELVQKVHSQVTEQYGHPEQYPYIDIWRYCIKNKSHFIMIAGRNKKQDPQNNGERERAVLVEQPEESDVLPPSYPSCYGAAREALSAAVAQAERGERAAAVSRSAPSAPSHVTAEEEQGAAGGGDREAPPEKIEMPDGSIYKLVPHGNGDDEKEDENQGVTTRAANNIYKHRDPYQHNPYKSAMQMPLREVPGPPLADGNPGPMQYTYVPFTTTDLFNWKTHTPLYSTNPAAVASMIESVMLTHNPTWADCQQLMLTMFTKEERARINSSAQNILLAQAVADAKPHPEAWAEEHYPKTDPKWPYNTVEGVAHLQTYRTAVIMGVKAGGKKPTNMGKIADVIQEVKESPSAFLERFLDAYRIYSPIDPEAVENQRLINSSFVGQSQRDIRNKIQRIDGFLGKGISELVEIANKVYHNRDLEEIKKQKGHTGVVGYMGNGGGRGGPDRGRARGRGARGRGRGVSRKGHRGSAQRDPGLKPKTFLKGPCFPLNVCSVRFNV
uniref:Gag protein n=1 Tax=Leptobrachium leishanense TaxID=445787 RepID=A0A8C5MNJ8_9ANUR